MQIPSANTDAWTGAEGEYEDYPTILRFRPNLVNHLGNANYPNLLTVIWKYKFSDDSGMPSEEQSDEMKGFEDMLITLLDPSRIGILAFIYTSAGMREWHYYIGDVDKTMSTITDELANYPRYPIRFELSDDPDWQELNSVLESCVEP